MSASTRFKPARRSWKMSRARRRFSTPSSCRIERNCWSACPTECIVSPWISSKTSSRRKLSPSAGCCKRKRPANIFAKASVSTISYCGHSNRSSRNSTSTRWWSYRTVHSARFHSRHCTTGSSSSSPNTRWRRLPV